LVDVLTTRSGRRASQHPEELAGLIGLMREEGVRSYLEIGARHGDTFFDVVRSMPAGSAAVAVDLPGGRWGTHKSLPHLKAAVRELVGMGYRASFIIGDSRAAGVRQAVMLRGPYGLALIDGDHTLAGVTADWENYRKMARIVAFHDIVGEGQADKSGNPVEVPGFWCALTGRRAEYVAEGSGMGIGAVWA
jgi:hypothetical protein